MGWGVGTGVGGEGQKEALYVVEFHQNTPCFLQKFISD